jgi:hypothetical protein
VKAITMPAIASAAPSTIRKTMVSMFDLLDTAPRPYRRMGRDILAG